MSYNAVGRNLLKVYNLGPEDVKLKETSSSPGENKRIDKYYTVNANTFKAFPETVAICTKLNQEIKRSKKSLNDKLYIPIFTLGISMLTKKAKDDILTGEDIELDTFDDDFYSLHKESILKKEDSEIFGCINAAVPPSHTLLCLSPFSIHMFNQGVNVISEHGITVKNVLMHPSKYYEILDWDEKILGKHAVNEISETGNLSSIRNIKINVSDQVNKDSVYFLADPEIVGALPIARDKHIFAYFDKNERVMKYGVKEEIGIAVMTDFAISKCYFDR